MRQFVVVGHDAPVTPDFPLDDLPSAGSRLDVLCRCVNSAFFLSHDLRVNVRLYLILRDELAVRFEGRELRHLNPDERSTAARIRDALAEREDAIGHQETNPSPGVYLSRRGLDAVLDAAHDATTLQLHEQGQPVIDQKPPSDPLFVLSDHRDFADLETTLLEDRADSRIRLGPQRLHADHAITVAHNWLDTDGFRRY